MVRIVIADDFKGVRLWIRGLLEEVPEFKIVGEVSDGETAIKLVEEFRPDVLVIDVSMPGISGIQVAIEVHDRFPRTAIVVLTMNDSESYVKQALAAGAKGFVVKEMVIIDQKRTLTIEKAHIT